MADKIDVKAFVFGQRLQSYREKAGITQQEMADACGLSKNYISAIERGIHKCNADTFITYGLKCSVSLDVLAGNGSSGSVLPALNNELASLDETQQSRVLDMIRLMMY